MPPEPLPLSEVPLEAAKPSRVQSHLLNAGLLLLLTCAAIAIHGYHLGIEDEAIYLPAIKKLLTPSLYPHDAEFFMGQTRGTALPLLVASSVRLMHVPLNWAVFAWQFAALFLMLLGCHRIARCCFADALDQWGGVTLVTALLTLPISGTGLYIADQHLHPREPAAIRCHVGQYEAGQAPWPCRLGYVQGNQERGIERGMERGEQQGRLETWPTSKIALGISLFVRISVQMLDPSLPTRETRRPSPG